MIERIQRASSSELDDLRRELGERRSALLVRAGAASSAGGAEAALLMGSLTELVIAECALETVASALEDGEPAVLSAPGARIRALDALAAEGGSGTAIHAVLAPAIVAIAEQHPGMDDAAAWAIAAGHTAEPQRERFVRMGLAAARRARDPRPSLALLDVVSEPEALAVGRELVALFAANEGVVAQALGVARLSEAGAHHLFRGLVERAGAPPAGAGPAEKAVWARLLAQVSEVLRGPEGREAAGLALALAGGEEDVSWSDAEREALVSHLDGPDLERALDDMPSWPSAALAERLARLGRVGEAQALVERWASTGWYRADSLLRAASAAPELSPGARQAIEALDAPGRGRLCGERPAAAVRVLGAPTVLRFADGSADPFGQYVRIAALSRVAAALPEPERPRAAEKALDAFHQDRDLDALDDLVRCAPWMPVPQATMLLVETLGGDPPQAPFSSIFAGHASIAALAPLIARAAGDSGLLAAAKAIIHAEGSAVP